MTEEGKQYRYELWKKETEKVRAEYGLTRMELAKVLRMFAFRPKDGESDIDSLLTWTESQELITKFSVEVLGY